MFIITLLILLPLLLLAAGFIVFSGIEYWYRQQTANGRYFRLTLAEKLRFQQQLLCYGRWLLPVLERMAHYKADKTPASITFNNTRFPAASCSEQTLHNALHYRPQSGDIIVATAMKSGTTWLQQIVFELLHQGQGDLSDNGYRHLYAASPWLETGNLASVALTDAPRLGKTQQRLIKTHLPASLCPWSESARYIYLLRDPGDTWASCRDFLQMLTGSFCADEQTLLDWFCSDAMWWRDWPSHAAGWWQRSQQQHNVLFLHYHALLANPADQIRRIADFLQLPCDEQVLHAVLHKSSKAYMMQHPEQFSMATPTLFSVRSGNAFIQPQKAAVPDAIRQHITAYCSMRLQHSGLDFETVMNCQNTDK